MRQENTSPEHLIFHRLIRAALQDPAHRASRLSDETHTYRYEEVVHLIDDIQKHLQACGLQPGDCVTAELTNTCPSAITVLALLDGGYSFLHTRLATSSAASAGKTPAPAFTRSVVSISLDATRTAGERMAAEWVDVKPNPLWSPTNAPMMEHPCVYSATSGSLGASKIVPRTYRNFQRNLRSAAQALPLDPGMRIAVTTPIYHQFGLGTGLMLGLLQGANLDFHDRPNALRYLERERVFDPDVALVVPTLLETLLRVRRRSRPYRFMLTGGDTTSAATRERAESLHGPLITAYGCSEFGFAATTRIDDPQSVRLSARCLPLPGVEARLRAIPGQEEGTGELLLRSDCQFKGYIDTDGTDLVRADAWLDGWFRTGDLARLWPDGSLQILGRCDLSVNRNGMLLPFADVEASLRAMPGVAQAAVVAGAEGIRGRELIAFCVPVPGARLSEQAIRTQYAASYPDWATPDLVYLLPEMPLLASGKIDRQALQALADRGMPRG